MCFNSEQQKYLEARIHVDHKSVEILSRDTIYEHCSKKTGHLTLDEAKDFMLDGGCFVLIRYLVQEEFIGRVDTFSALLSGKFRLWAERERESDFLV